MLKENIHNNNNNIISNKNEIEINEQLDAKEVEHIKDICRRNGYYGEYNDWRSSEPILDGHAVNYLKAYKDWAGYDY